MVGPVPTLDRALALLAAAPDLDGAVLNVNLGGQMAYPLADALERRRVPFVFATGYAAESIPERYAHVPLCQKPATPAAVARALADHMSRAGMEHPRGAMRTRRGTDSDLVPLGPRGHPARRGRT